MPGIGSQPAGSSPYGIGTPAVYGGNLGKPLQDENDVMHGSRFIDPVAKDYVVDVNGRVAGMPNVHQLVLLAVSTTRGTAAMRSLGHELRKIDRITSNFARRVDTSLRSAVAPLVARGLIEVVSTSVEILQPGRAFGKLKWRDLTSGSSRIEETTTA